MRIRILLFACGIASALCLPELSFGYIGIVAGVLVLCWLVSRSLLPLFLLSGFIYCIIHAAILQIHSLKPALEEQIVHVEGRVVGLPTKESNKTRFIFKPERVIDSDVNIPILPKKIQTSWYKTEEIIKPGQLWRLGLKLKAPHGFHNPGIFDYELWLFQQGIQARAYVHKQYPAVLIDDKAFFSVDRYRYELSQWLAKQTYLNHRSIYQALIVGDRSNLSTQQWSVFRQTGTSHLIAISGLHITLIASLFFFLSKLVWARSYFLTNLVPATNAAMYTSITMATLYSAMAGFSLPTLRALIMLLVYCFSRMYATSLSIVNVLFIAVFLILLMDPFSLLKPDFWLSFTAVALIAYLLIGRKQQNKLWLMVKIQLFLSLSLLPLTLYYFNMATLNGVLANLVAVPLTGFIVLPLLFLSLALFFFPTAQQLILSFVDVCFEYFWHFLNFLTSIEYSFLQNNTGTNLIALVFMLIASLLLFLPKGLPGRQLGIVCFLPFCFFLPQRPVANEFELNFLDVGQGLAIVMQTQHHDLLFDTGAKFSDKFDIGSGIIVPFLQHKGITELDKVIISHGDNDHIGGLSGVLGSISAKQVISSVAHQAEYASHIFCEQGLIWELDNVRFEFLHPSSKSINHLSKNNASCVLMIHLPNYKILLTADIEQKAEEMLLKQYGEDLKADIMLIPHHGSRTSSTAAFIQQVNPKIAIVSAGYANRFGFPKQDVIERYKSRDIKVLNTANTGAITLKFSEDSMSVTTSRNEYRRFWHHSR